MKITKVDVFGAASYRLNVNSTIGYQNGETGGIAAAPLIHTYNPSSTTVAAPVALLSGDITEIMLENKLYTVKHFLTVQPFDKDFMKDESMDKNADKAENDLLFRPSVKPHYALAEENGEGVIYNKYCKFMLLDEQGVNFYKDQDLVLVHDEAVSPDTTIDPLKTKLLDAYPKDSSIFFTSYVIDELNHQILITQHCLLQERELAFLLERLGNMKDPSLEKLLKIATPISSALQKFQRPLFEEIEFIKETYLAQNTASGARQTPPIDTVFPTPLAQSAQASRTPPEIYELITKLKERVGKLKHDDPLVIALKNFTAQIKLLESSYIANYSSKEGHVDERIYDEAYYRALACLNQQVRSKQILTKGFFGSIRTNEKELALIEPVLITLHANLAKTKSIETDADAAGTKPTQT